MMIFAATQLAEQARRGYRWVGRVYVVLITVCLVWIYAAGCSNHGPRVEMAPQSGPVIAGEQVRLLQSRDGVAELLPEGLAWEVDGVPGGSPFYGQVLADGVYVAPEVSAPRSFTVRLVRRNKGGAEVLATRVIDVLPRPRAQSVTREES